MVPSLMTRINPPQAYDLTRILHRSPLLRELTTSIHLQVMEVFQEPKTDWSLYRINQQERLKQKIK